ncbi:MAG: DUF4469 domain-containing protein [Treponema sp.]|jgi:hypothetical protein|nr:DUF4469 domain-containing protein [Treponema sp.]
MQIKNQITDVLHKIRVKLYPNYFQHVEGKYIARTNNEAVLGVDKVCNAAISRGGVECDLDDLIEYVNKYNEEVAYQLCDGYAVSNGYYTIHPNVGGTFNSENDVHDHKKHPITFRFRVLNKMRRLSQFISVTIEGIADVSGYIDEFIDYEADSTNTFFVPGDQFAIHGHKIKVAGDDPGNGVYLVPVDDPGKKVKITRIAENGPSRITGVLPASTGYSNNRIEIHTQYSGASDNFLKIPRVITSPFILEEA